MKVFILFLLISLALAVPLDSLDQIPLAQAGTNDGYSLDLNAPRLIQLDPESAPEWVTESHKIQLKAFGHKFFDITDNQDLGISVQSPTRVKRLFIPPLFINRQTRATDHFPSIASFPSPNATEKVVAIFKNLSTDGPKKNLRKFTNFRTRYYRSDTGKASQKWLLSRISEVIIYVPITRETAAESLQTLITLREFEHSWGQNSIIVRIEGSSVTDNGVVVIGAHQDSTNLWPFLPAPGADGKFQHDGSGSVTILEAYRALLVADFRPSRTVEFHWYSAEEGGLLGSQAVAQAYASESVNVIAMSQFDMTAWVKRGTREEAGIIVDFVDQGLTKFNMELVDMYLDIPYVKTQCGYACSDHASWGKAGYPSTFTIESAFENSNKNIHSVNDRIDISDEFSFDHMLEFSKLAVAFAVELGGSSD
ncbi:hypothetical protein D9757_000194 [Collybiopsis confluens]|uniref:Peptide hydrolase n=1 Tax=Collybiopsis confluens TaxID=2823264 RepID=A0A8H5I2B1_9AGAR|nr:hypothetical protein D9757_000194 [Collybiopsis confluens]